MVLPESIGSFDKVEVKSLSQIVAERLRDMIYAGQLKPGERLIQNDLAAYFDVSRVAIRDALQELKISGLAVTTSSAGGFCVRPIEPQDISDVAFLRNAVEPPIAAKACLNIDKKGIRKLEKLIEKQSMLCEVKDVIGYIPADWEFHKTLYEYAYNSLALEIIEKLWMRSNQARGLVLFDHQWGESWCRRSVENHKEILEAVSARDTQRIFDISVKNVKSAEKEQLEWLSKIK